MKDTQSEINECVNNFIYDVKRGKINGSYDITINTVDLLKKIISQTEWQTARELLKLISAEGRRLIKSLPLHASVGNMVRRILKIIREEYVVGRKVYSRNLDKSVFRIFHAVIFAYGEATLDIDMEEFLRTMNENKQEEVDPQESLHKIVTSEGDVDDYNTVVPQLKASIIEHIGEFQTELETSAENIAQQAREHIHSNEIIMTVGKSSAVEAFLKAAAAERKFDVIVAECAPFCRGHELAVSLGKSKIQTTLIADSAIFAIMSRVNKVIIGTHTVMANGGLRSVCGSHIVALAAKHYSVPVIVLAPMYKLSPLHLCSYDQDAFNNYVSPEGVLNYSDGAILSKVHVFNPVFDYVPPELVTLFISNTGGHAPSYVYRLLSELYHPEDRDF